MRTYRTYTCILLNNFFKSLVLGILLIPVVAFSQNDPKWDDTKKSNWPESFEEVEIPSSADGAIQKAIFYKSESEFPKPLIVSLHTWSGDYSQKDPMAREILARDWNYIHPDFRGPNNSPKAMGSPLVISDIKDAIAFALDNTNADPEEVHIIGVSGGGYATLLAYMNLEYPVKSFSAWAPISDIEAWYWESLGRNQKYAGDILNAVSEDSIFNVEEAIKRSPINQKYPRELRKNAELFIYEGVHDGYDGSVPITHSINMYNRLVGELKYGYEELDHIMPKASSDSDLVSEKEIINLLTKRLNPDYDKNVKLFDRSIYLSRDYKDIHLRIFEGGHEQIPQALSLIPYVPVSDLKVHILTIGDSNAEIENGWVDQLAEMLSESDIQNISQSGRTIGFDNLGREELNALKNINMYLDQALEKSGGKDYDYIVLCLGTNDTKNVFAERQEEVTENFKKLLSETTSHKLYKKQRPELIFVSPPPMRAENMIEKYQGGNDRLAKLTPELIEIAKRGGFITIDVYHPLLGVLEYYAEDGVHMAGEGQKIIAAKIVDTLKMTER